MFARSACLVLGESWMFEMCRQEWIQESAHLLAMSMVILRLICNQQRCWCRVRVCRVGSRVVLLCSMLDVKKQIQDQGNCSRVSGGKEVQGSNAKSQ